MGRDKAYRPLPIGVDSFEKVINGGYYYVDKTLLIKELLDMKGEVNLFTRPRRFGKTLNMTMLRSFFELPETDEAVEKQKRLFSGLAISQAGEKYTAQMGQYPVIFLTLKSGKQNEWELAYGALCEVIEREFSRHSDVLQSDRLLQSEKEQYLRILRKEREPANYQTALQFLSQCLEKVYKRKTIILIDEYDVPLENAHFRGFYDEMIGFLRSLFESALKTNEFLEFAVLTGCLRISKESIFTGLNNLEIISIRNNLYAEHFGFTQAEVDFMLAFYDCVESRREVKDWYDGYLFGATEVYNPWSMVNYVKQRAHNPDAFAAPYWSNTSGNAIVRSLIEQADGTTKAEIEQLIACGVIEKPVHEDITYDEVDNTMENLWNFLYFTGYLTKVSERREEESGIAVTLRIPNIEVKYIYETHIRGWFSDQLKHTDLNPLFAATLEGQVLEVEQHIGRLLRESISYMDSREAFYHGFLAGVYKAIGNGYIVKSNRESGAGRYDLLLCAPDYTKAVVIELKVVEKKTELQAGCRAALKQIYEKDYAQELLDDGYDEVLCYGMAFWRKLCRVGSEQEDGLTKV